MMVRFSGILESVSYKFSQNLSILSGFNLLSLFIGARILAKLYPLLAHFKKRMDTPLLGDEKFIIELIILCLI